MSSPAPRPLLPSDGARRPGELIVRLALVLAIVFGVLITLRVFGLLRPFFVPNGGMAPSVSAGDHVLMEGVTFLARKPGRGDIVVFKTDGIATLPPDQLYIKRVAGEPGDRLQIVGGKLYVNDRSVALSNAAGEISYLLPPMPESLGAQTNVTVPDGCYFVLGDNSTNSLDSRFWGSLPGGNIKGRIFFCYWPLSRIGAVK